MARRGTSASPLAPYDPLWPERFLAERAWILRALDDLEARVEHIGSTAVPGLIARPVIDIMIGAPAAASRDPYIAALRGIGYTHADTQRIPGRELLRRGTPRSHHVHLVTWGSELWDDYLAFRDYLRSHPATLIEYATLKRELLRARVQNRDEEQIGKGPFIQSIVRLARQG
jgi:GrpB-like predicted nucleotidyltransferase (UPF0157 family)